MERTRLRRRPAVHLPRGTLPPNNDDSQYNDSNEGVNGSGGSGEAVALRCGAEERITAENLVQGDWDEGRGWEVQMLPDSPSASTSTKSGRREVRTNGCGAPVHGGLQGNSNGGYWFAWNSRGVGGGRGGVAETVVPLDTAYFPDALRKGLRLGQGGAACGCEARGVGCAVCGNPLGALQSYCPTHAHAHAQAHPNSPSSSSRSMGLEGYMFAPSAVTATAIPSTTISTNTTNTNTSDTSDTSDTNTTQTDTNANTTQTQTQSPARWTWTPDMYNAQLPRARALPVPPGERGHGEEAGTRWPPTLSAPPWAVASASTAASSAVPPFAPREGAPSNAAAAASASNPRPTPSGAAATAPPRPAPRRRRTLRRPGSVERYFAGDAGDGDGDGDAGATAIATAAAAAATTPDASTAQGRVGSTRSAEEIYREIVTRPRAPSPSTFIITTTPSPTTPTAAIAIGGGRATASFPDDLWRAYNDVDTARSATWDDNGTEGERGLTRTPRGVGELGMGTGLQPPAWMGRDELVEWALMTRAEQLAVLTPLTAEERAEADRREEEEYAREMHMAMRTGDRGGGGAGGVLDSLPSLAQLRTMSMSESPPPPPPWMNVDSRPLPPMQPRPWVHAPMPPPPPVPWWAQDTVGPLAPLPRPRPRGDGGGGQGRGAGEQEGGGAGAGAADEGVIFPASPPGPVGGPPAFLPTPPRRASPPPPSLPTSGGWSQRVPALPPSTSEPEPEYMPVLFVDDGADFAYFGDADVSGYDPDSDSNTITTVIEGRPMTFNVTIERPAGAPSTSTSTSALPITRSRAPGAGIRDIGIGAAPDANPDPRADLLTSTRTAIAAERARLADMQRRLGALGAARTVGAASDPSSASSASTSTSDPSPASPSTDPISTTATTTTTTNTSTNTSTSANANGGPLLTSLRQIVHDQTALLARVNGLIGALQGGVSAAGALSTAGASALSPATTSAQNAGTGATDGENASGNGHAYATVTWSAISDALRSARAENANASASAGDGIGNAREVLARAREALERADRTVRQTGDSQSVSVPGAEPQSSMLGVEPQPQTRTLREEVDMLIRRRRTQTQAARDSADSVGSADPANSVNSTGAGELSDVDMGMVRRSLAQTRAQVQVQTQTLQQLRARLTAVTEASAARRAERGGVGAGAGAAATASPSTGAGGAAGAGAGGEDDPDKRPQRRRIFFER